MKKTRWTMLPAILLFGSAAYGQGILEVLNRSNVGTVTSGGNARLKFDFLATPAEQTYDLGSPPSFPGTSTNVFPVAGRWLPDTTESVGYYVRNNDTFYLRTAQTTGLPTLSFKFFSGTTPAGILYPVMGDWNGDGIDTAGIYDRSTGKVYLKNSNSTLAPVAHTITYPGVSGAGWLPVAGDWDGNGTDEVGVFSRQSDVFRLFGNVPSTSFTDYSVPTPTGATTKWPLAGDWNFDGKDFVGVYGSNNKTFYLLSSSAQTSVWSFVFAVSNAAARPVAGSWDGESFRYNAPSTAGGNRPRTFPQLIHTAGNNFDLYFSAPAETLSGSESLYFNQYSGSHLFTNSGWQLATSVELVGNTGATALGTVLSDSAAVFKHPSGSFYKKLVVYVVEHAVPGQFAGWACLSYSNGNNVWTQPIFATNDPSVTPRPCVSPGNSTFDVLAELVSGFRDGPNLHFGVMNGDNPTIIADGYNETTRTHTYLYTASTSKPWYFAPQGEFTNNGVTTPNTGGRWVYNYGINLDFTFDPVEYAIYWSRTYPYPFDIDGSIPCDNQGCPSGVSQNPNRAQVYKIDLVPGETQSQHLARFFKGPWVLLLDTGSSKGYPTTSGSVCASTALTSPFQYPLMGIDLNSVTFVKDEDGVIWRDAGGKRTMLFGGAAVKDRTNGECDFADRSMFVWREP